MSSFWEKRPYVWMRQALNVDEVSKLQGAGQLDGAAGRRLGAEGVINGAIAPVTRAINLQFGGYQPVRVVSFAKTDDANWQVPWHQDRVIAVQEKADIDGFGNWSKKSDQWHCEPPVQILEDMLFVRVFLDPCNAETGGMEFSVGSHVAGLIPFGDAVEMSEAYLNEIEEAEAGDILVLPMLTLHRSRPAETVNNRRVLRIDYARDALPEPLHWIDYVS